MGEGHCTIPKTIFSSLYFWKISETTNLGYFILNALQVQQTVRTEKCPEVKSQTLISFTGPLNFLQRGRCGDKKTLEPLADRITLGW
jgi:hypothetical protein